ncbi:MAG TPA: type I methionyl aminopeptidase, partial [Thermoanaerobacter sp.]|nr:type I methionyl aminopeptidase [Thermoanaerobacter sp.]
MIYIKSKNEIDLMRTAGKVIANLFEVLERAIKPGVTTL